MNFRIAGNFITKKIDPDQADLEEVYEKTERHLLYIACAWARDCYSNILSEFIDDLTNIRQLVER